MWRRLTEAQWAQVRVHLPRPRAAPRGGRPRADDRKCFEGILWVLWTGAPWSELPGRYGSPTTCWRRLRDWETDGTLLALWRAFLAELHDADRLRWDECFADGSFAPAKRGARGWETQAGQGHEVDGGGRWRRYSAGSTPGLGVAARGHAPRTHARHDRGPARAHAGTPAPASRSADCGSGV